METQLIVSAIVMALSFVAGVYDVDPTSGVATISALVLVWVSLGTGAMPFVELPNIVESVILAGDNNAAGHAAVAAATEAFTAQGRAVCATYPDQAFLDWNDQLMGRRREA